MLIHALAHMEITGQKDEQHYSSVIKKTSLIFHSEITFNKKLRSQQTLLPILSAIDF